MKVAANFDGSKVAISDDYLCKVTVYDYDKLNNSWTLETELTSGVSLASNGFGVSMSMDWDAERIVVGANTISNVYTFDYVNSAWSTTPRVIEGTSGSDFGFSVSMAANDTDILCVGAPLENKVYVYQNIQGNWNQTYVNDGTSILSRIPLTPTSNVILKPEYNAYGYHVYMSSEGDRIIAGAPGTYMSNIFTSNILSIETNGVFSDPEAGLDWPFGTDNETAGTGVAPGTMKHVGNARVLTRNDNTWSQLGSDIGGDPDIYILGDEVTYTGYFKRDFTVTTSGWCVPAFGTCTHITSENEYVITVSSPGYTLETDRDRGYFSGKISRFKYSEDLGDWEPYGIDIISRYKVARYGESFAFDFSGTRVAVGLQPSFLKDLDNTTLLLKGRVHVIEWNGISWYEPQEMILLEGPGGGSLVRNDRTQPMLVNGKNIFCTSVTTGKMYTKDVDLTQVITGNSLFSGYVSTDILKIGSNNGDYENLTSKKILFGGTRGDQSYEYSSIENRSLVKLGKSELLHFKRSGSIGATDIIRLKSSEIHLDNFIGGEIVSRTIGNPVSILETKEKHYPSLVINWKGGVCVNPHVRQDLGLINTIYSRYTSDGGPDDYYASCESKAVLDINGDVYMRNRLNINDYHKNRMKGTWINEPQYFYDTRDFDVIFQYVDESIPNNTLNLYNTKLVKSLTRGKITYNYNGVVEGDVEYSEEYRGFEFTGDGKITNVIPVSYGHEPMCVSFWILLKNQQLTYSTSNLVSLGSCVTVQMTDTHFKILYEDTVGTGTSYSFDCGVSLEQGRWYNVQVQLPGGTDNFPQITDANTRRTYVGLWLDKVQQTLTLNGDNTAFKSRVGQNSSYIVGGNTENIVMGLIAYWYVSAWRDKTVLISNNPSVQEPYWKEAFIKSNYDYGPPTEMLAVGGDATISGKLGVGLTNPSTTLDVNGNAQTNVGYVHRSIVLRDANSGYTTLTSGSALNLGTLQSGVTGSFQSPMIQRGVQNNFVSGDGARWSGNKVVIGFRYVAEGTGLNAITNSFRVYSNNYQTSTTVNYDWTASDDGFDRGYMSTSSPPLISHTGDVPSIWLANISAHTVRINAIWVEYVNI
jgi:hypothetical protein